MRPALRAFVTSFVLPALASGTAALVVVNYVADQRFGAKDDRVAWVADAANLIHQRYLDEVPVDTLMYDAIRGMASSRDRYSEFVDPTELAEFREENEGKYVGIGFVTYPKGEPVTVLYAFPGSPAEQAGLEPGDRIVAVDGEPTAGKTQEQVTARIKIANGAGRAVSLRVRPWSPPGGAPRPEVEVEVVRADIQRPSVFDPRILDPERGIAYVRVAAFQDRTADELRATLAALADQGMRALALDLRRNHGGVLDQAIGVASLFLGDGKVVVRTRGRTEDSNHDYETDRGTGEFASLPLAVLVDDETASAGEIVAGALQDHLRAPLIGARTYGKGVVQSQIQRRFVIGGEEKVALLKITTSRYLTPSGRFIEQDVGRDAPERGGLAPDVLAAIDSKEEYQDLGKHFEDREIPETTWSLIRARGLELQKVAESKQGFRDRQLECAVAVLKGEPAFSPLAGP